jgi:rhamnosyltransferase subunit B
LNVLLPTLGSSGDVHPFIALGLALRARGHRATVLTNPIFQPLIEAQGLGFASVGSADAAYAAIADPDVWHPRKGFKIIARVMVPAIAEVFRCIERRADADTVVAFSTLAFGARVAQEKLGIASASVHLQPSVFRTLADQGMLGQVRLSASHPAWLKKAVFWLADALILDRNLKGPLNAFRASLGLTPVDRVMDRWMHSPELVLACFPDWFALPQPDWPPQTHAVGFLLWDQYGEAAEWRAAERFLEAGSAPLIFTPGSAASTLQRFFAESVEASRRLGRRAMLVTNFPEQVPRRLPAGIQVFGYLPFSRVLPRAALLVHHGGIGTLAQGIRAGVPQLVVPNGYDQFDSGWRIERLGLGRCVPQSRYRAARAAARIGEILAADATPLRLGVAARIDPAAAVTRACELLEGLMPTR